jgi:hypothetical protein
MSKEFLHILVSAKIAVGVLSVAAPSAAVAAAPPSAGKAGVSSYEVFGAQSATVSEVGGRGDATSTGNTNC